MRKTTPLRNLRRARTISQADFARLVGIGQQYLSKIENETVVPSRDVQDLIAAKLGVSRAECGFPAKRARTLVPADRPAA
jgi:transcriptional regulator with XRE-family HTH domain